MRSLLVIFLLALISAACSRAPEVRKYAMHGEIMALNADDHIATIKHDKIGDWMGAMTMEYRIKNPADWQKLKVGERIDATVFVSPESYYVGDVKVSK
jgi:Cu/Ag efflux protein CusF